jgi:hypothetical protein
LFRVQGLIFLSPGQRQVDHSIRAFVDDSVGLLGCALRPRRACAATARHPPGQQDANDNPDLYSHGWNYSEINAIEQEINNLLIIQIATAGSSPCSV